MYTILDQKGFVLNAQYNKPDNGNYTEMVLTENFIKAKFIDGVFIEGANQEEINSDNEIKKVELKKTQYKELLKTDWYFVRLAETGQEVPKEVLEQRNLIRNR
jgi:hypothetical protein